MFLRTRVVAKSNFIENVLSWAKFKADKDAKKTDGSKRTRYVVAVHTRLSHH